MRTIKFRGKRIDNGEWVYGDLLHRWWLQGEEFTDTAIRYKIGELYSHPIPVDPVTIGQFIHNNGKFSYYEGDIVAYSETYQNLKLDNYEFVGVIKCSAFEFIAEGVSRWIGIYKHLDYNFEPIGNIHDNPELLK